MTDETGTPPVLTIHGSCATLRLNRPRKLNRIEPDDLVSLTDSLSRVEADPAVRVLVLTGTGRAFSAGFDLRAIGARAHTTENESVASRPPRDPISFESVTNRLECLAVPTICRLNGGVYGGSTDLALACDFRIGVDTMELVMPAARLGLHYYRSGIERYVSRLGPSAAKLLFLTAQRMDAAGLLRIGYLDEAVSADELDRAVDRLVDAIAANAPHAVRNMKRSLNEVARGIADADALDARHAQSLRSAELKEGSAAFAEKRAPRFE